MDKPYLYKNQEVRCQKCETVIWIVDRDISFDSCVMDHLNFRYPNNALVQNDDPLRCHKCQWSFAYIDRDGLTTKVIGGEE